MIFLLTSPCFQSQSVSHTLWKAQELFPAAARNLIVIMNTCTRLGQPETLSLWTLVFQGSFRNPNTTGFEPKLRHGLQPTASDRRQPKQAAAGKGVSETQLTEKLESFRDVWQIGRSLWEADYPFLQFPDTQPAGKLSEIKQTGKQEREKQHSNIYQWCEPNLLKQLNQRWFFVFIFCSSRLPTWALRGLTPHLKAGIFWGIQQRETKTVFWYLYGNLLWARKWSLLYLKIGIILPT